MLIFAAWYLNIVSELIITCFTRYWLQNNSPHHPQISQVPILKKSICIKFGLDTYYSAYKIIKVTATYLMHKILNLLNNTFQSVCHNKFKRNTIRDNKFLCIMSEILIFRPPFGLGKFLLQITTYSPSLNIIRDNTWFYFNTIKIHIHIVATALSSTRLRIVNYVLAHASVR